MFVSYNKKSKKDRRADDLMRRVIWEFCPITRVKKSKKLYSRQKFKKFSEVY